MSRRLLRLLLPTALVAASAAPVVAQPAQAPPGAPRKPAAPQATPAPHRTGELECQACHQGRHQGVLRMYIGMGGRGTPMIPSHMFQVRVECVACHILPREAEGRVGIVGQTFEPSEQACLGCHGEKYRGMLERWRDTLVRMREIVGRRLEAARAAVAGVDAANPKQTRARELVDDAEFNLRFVALAKGVHNVFYAADLLKVANGWLDEAMGLLGKSLQKSDDALVRGGYCAVLCHEQAGVKRRETVTFGRQRIPHVRHVTEFGAVCTACHSAEVHKAVTATPATCSSCHHNPQNDRCESCHRAQSAFYRGEVRTDLARVEPNVMASAVGCTGCHDWSRKHSRKAVGEKCVGCHDRAYLAFIDEWTGGLDKAAREVTEALRRGEAARVATRRAGRASPESDALLKQAREALALVRGAKGVHNPSAAQVLLDAARRKTEEASARATRR